MTYTRAPPPTSLPKLKIPQQDGGGSQKTGGRGAAMHQLQKAPVQGIQCHPAGCHHHTPGRCTHFKPEKTPGECAPSKQRRKKKNGANQKRRRCRILEIENANHRRTKGILRTRAERDPGITRHVAAGLGTSCPDRTEVSRSSF